jgi:hypothetical protein
MNKIKLVHILRFRNETHYEFLVVYGNLLDQYPEVKELLPPELYEAFTTLLRLEGILVDAMRKSNYTQKIADADHRVDGDIASLREIITAATRHFNPPVAEAAKILLNRLQSFGDISKKSYEAETAAVNLLIADLKSGHYEKEVALVGIDQWVLELEAAEKEFEELLAKRNAETAEKPQQRLKDVRREIDGKYDRMNDIIDANAILKAGVYDHFIARLNAEITYFNDHANRHAKKDLGAGDHTVVEPIPTQTYTGKPLAVIPKVHYREDEKPTVELVFATDFTVTYKNNTEVGTANLVIHGKGKYRGQKTVTFNIAR